MMSHGEQPSDRAEAEARETAVGAAGTPEKARDEAAVAPAGDAETRTVAENADVVPDEQAPHTGAVASPAEPSGLDAGDTRIDTAGGRVPATDTVPTGEAGADAGGARAGADSETVAPAEDGALVVAPAADDAAQRAAVSSGSVDTAPVGVDGAPETVVRPGAPQNGVAGAGRTRPPGGAVEPPGEARTAGGDDADDEEAARPLDDQELRSALEAMLLVVDAPAPVELLAAAVDDTPARVERMLREMSAEWTARGSGIDLRYVGDGWRLYTRTEYAPYVERMLLDGARSKLTRAALETLAVIAYRQPVTRARVSAVRGVNVDGVIRTLVARGLIAEAGTDVDTNGTLYVTTELFLERIGLASLAELPSLAPLLPGVDLIDEINESLETDPRYTKLKKPAESDIDLGTED
ncbi:Segregation and condensation protein B [Nocardia africana]|uniref:Segregation and condensation protein B n=1 Tax=Nocardia africana TaxID=134964 RepID=A0A378WSE9_9NOCA|nr:Segregation and condensation protein B [Nocardia africana]